MKRRRKMRPRQLDPNDLKTVRMSNLQLGILSEFVGLNGAKRLLTLEEVLAMKQGSVGSMRYWGFIEYRKSCTHSGACDCTGQGYTLSNLGRLVMKKFQPGGTNIYKAVNEDGTIKSPGISIWLKEDPINE